jgi:chitinase
VGNSVNVRSRLTRPNKNRINSESVSSSSSSGGSSSEVTSTTSTTVKPPRSRRPSPLRKSSTSGILSSKNSFSSSSGLSSASSGRNGTDKDYKIVCYYTNWSQYRPKIGKYLPENAEADLCTHIIFAFGWLKKGKLSSLESNDESVDGKVGLYERINQMKQANPKLKTLLAIGKFSSSIDNCSQMTDFHTFFLGNNVMEGKSLRNSRGHREIPL